MERRVGILDATMDNVEFTTTITDDTITRAIVTKVGQTAVATIQVGESTETIRYNSSSQDVVSLNRSTSFTLLDIV